MLSFFFNIISLTTIKSIYTETIAWDLYRNESMGSLQKQKHGIFTETKAWDLKGTASSL
jgi:hypothetical protein